jgi:hypothetical protein
VLFRVKNLNGGPASPQFARARARAQGMGCVA